MSSAALSQAEEIARRAHEGQIEESTGDPYIRHLERVVSLVEGDDAKAVAWLHDVLEDTAMEADDLATAGIPDHIIDAVAVLTRNVADSYTDYIEDIKKIGNQLAVTVKLADLRDHLRPNCPERLRSRYEKAWRVLTDELIPSPPRRRNDTNG